MDCKMDQMNQVVIVSRCNERVFGEEQWLTLRTKLATWRGNIANVISTIRANRMADDGSQAVHLTDLWEVERNCYGFPVILELDQMFRKCYNIVLL
nr:eukaryotic translation initiation factor 3 subunit M-like [Malus domestica]